MEGYAKLAHLMAKHEDFALVRRFKDLNYLNLLYSQAEITHLEDELRELVNEDSKGGQRRTHTRDWWTLAHSDDPSAQRQWKKIRRIRKKLNRYSEHACFLRQLPNPRVLLTKFSKTRC